MASSCSTATEEPLDTGQMQPLAVQVGHVVSHAITGSPEYPLCRAVCSIPVYCFFRGRYWTFSILSITEHLVGRHAQDG